ncbi:MAG: hypothetical protein GFH27_549305n7 [Chloroflexi bacterium AL-W]|nr:hypothetical protein [Chloroflexi bacterium AL-N1]NOK69253.1 hypothetical protein [Chloroflexi bacterium AL-N10]NOK76314.1 hypothetical protein [Chloroflexi bacterium AL-N5]NOK83431.1 hypothetical protein [Chloroflexi bacterium AL-W]NOK91091.1 hypothetical protein [Chloroflexi bacterium AL-N15]
MLHSRFFHTRRMVQLGIVVLLCISAISCQSEPESNTVPTFPDTEYILEGEFLTFWQRNDGEQALGPPISAPLWLDGNEVQFFTNARLNLASNRVVKTDLTDGWQTTLPTDLFGHQVATQQVTMEAPDQAEPLVPISVTLATPEYSGPVELRLYDSRAEMTGSWQVEAQDGLAEVMVEGRGALGPQQAIAFIDDQIAGATTALFELNAQTLIETGQPRFDTFYSKVKAFMEQNTMTYDINGEQVHGYRSPDSALLWLRDHAYQARGFRYFEQDMTSLIDGFRREQRPDGSFPDYLARPEIGIPAERMEVEADVEYLFVQAVYEAWQISGDDAWLESNLDAMRKGLMYSMSDPLRWDEDVQLVKRPFTIDTWDFEYGPATRNPNTGRLAPRHWIDDDTIWGIFHGDNTGLAFALELLARIETHFGNEAAAERWRTEADGIMDRLNDLSWNGDFFLHHVQIQQPIFDVPGVDESRQLSLSNTYALNREVLEPEQSRAIIEEYFRRFEDRGDTFAEWYGIDPPFPSGSYGMAGRPGEEPGEYLNGGIMPLVGGELARGAFQHGAENYGFNILWRYFFLIDTTGESYLWYYPAGNPGKSGPDTLPTDGWGSSAMLGALIEGAAGIEDRGVVYNDVRLSPRWSSLDDVTDARVVARYAASDGYVAYQWQRGERTLSLDFTSPAERIQVRLMLPPGQKEVTEVMLDGQPQTYELEDVFGSWYIIFEVEQGSGTVEVALS